MWPNSSDYLALYSRLAAGLGVPGAVPPVDEEEAIGRLTGVEHYPRGAIGRADVPFLTALGSILAPEMVIEIGTASGFSAIVLASAVARGRAARGNAVSEVLVHTIDRKSHWLPDPEKATGFMIAEFAPELRSRIVIHTERDSAYARGLVVKGMAVLGFVDGNHQHPWPLIDVLNLDAVMRRGDWIILHDIEHAERATGKGQPARGRSGAKHVFEHWPGGKISHGNIGAVQLTGEAERMKAFVEKLSVLPMETPKESTAHYVRWVRRLLAEL